MGGVTPSHSLPDQCFFYLRLQLELTEKNESTALTYAKSARRKIIEEVCTVYLASKKYIIQMTQ